MQVRHNPPTGACRGLLPPGNFFSRWTRESLSISRRQDLKRSPSSPRASSCFGSRSLLPSPPTPAHSPELRGLARAGARSEEAHSSRRCVSKRSLALQPRAAPHTGRRKAGPAGGGREGGGVVPLTCRLPTTNRRVDLRVAERRRLDRLPRFASGLAVNRRRPISAARQSLAGWRGTSITELVVFPARCSRAETHLED